MNRSRNAGYTLVELIITVGIIGLLAGIAIPSYNGYLEVSKRGAAVQNAEQLAIFLDNYFYENGTYIAGNYVPGGDTTTLPNALMATRTSSAITLLPAVVAALMNATP